MSPRPSEPRASTTPCTLFRIPPKKGTSGPNNVDTKTDTAKTKPKNIDYSTHDAAIQLLSDFLANKGHSDLVTVKAMSQSQVLKDDADRLPNHLSALLLRAVLDDAAPVKAGAVHFNISKAFGITVGNYF